MLQVRCSVCGPETEPTRSATAAFGASGIGCPPRAVQHSCGGYYTAYETAAGYVREPPHCVVSGYGRCYDTPEIALAVSRGDLDGTTPDGGESRD